MGSKVGCGVSLPFGWEEIQCCGSCGWVFRPTACWVKPIHFVGLVRGGNGFGGRMSVWVLSCGMGSWRPETDLSDLYEYVGTDLSNT